MNLDGEKIVVTGGAQGLGLRSAQLFVELGAQVFLMDVNSDTLAPAAAALGAGFAVGDVTRAAEKPRVRRYRRRPTRPVWTGGARWCEAYIKR